MNGMIRIGLILVALIVPGMTVAHSQELQDPWFQEAVDYRDGRISLMFEQVPVVVALNAIEERTGFQIIVPPTVEQTLVNLRLDHSALEPAFQSLIYSIGFRNFALIYGPDGRPRRAVVLNAHPEIVASADDNAKDEEVPLEDGEKEKLQGDLERWGALNQEARGRIEDRLRTLPPSDEREQLMQEYGRQILAAK